jgi:DNA-binding CsgD family transcriptional regulator
MAALDGPRPIGLLDTQLAQSQPIGSPAFFWAAALLERNRPGDASRAADLLEAFRATPAARHPWRLAEALPLLAAAREAMGDRAAAMAIMAETLAQEPGVLVRRFADAGPFSLAVLRRLAASDDPLAERAARVLDAISPPATDPGPLSTLTSREREVLELMGHWLTNKEIATRLGISPNTVRQHSVSIFRKLGVEDRRDAVDVLLATRRPMLRQRADHTVPGNP